MTFREMFVGLLTLFAPLTFIEAGRYLDVVHIMELQVVVQDIVRVVAFQAQVINVQLIF